MERLRSAVVIVAAAGAILTLVACGKERESARKAPTCAVRDCETGKIVDDGCVRDGLFGRTCAACTFVCPGQIVQ